MTFKKLLVALTVVLVGIFSANAQVAQFDFPATNSTVVSVKDPNVTVSNMTLSAGTIETNITTGTYFPNEPYVEETGGWTATTQAAAKSFQFTITASPGYIFSITNISFRSYSTAAGPSAVGFAIGSTDLYAVNAPDSSLLTVNQAVSGQTGLTTATIKIQGWLNGSRTSAGSGVLRLDDIVVTGVCHVLKYVDRFRLLIESNLQNKLISLSCFFCIGFIRLFIILFVYCLRCF